MCETRNSSGFWEDFWEDHADDVLFWGLAIGAITVVSIVGFVIYIWLQQ